MTYKLFTIEVEGQTEKVKDIELSDWLIENAVNNYEIIKIQTVELQ